MSIKGKQNLTKHLPHYVVHIKWNKVTLNDIDLDTQSDVLTFKTQIYALTNVPVDK